MDKYAIFAELFKPLGISRHVFEEKLNDVRLEGFSVYFQQLLLQRVADECVILYQKEKMRLKPDHWFRHVFDNQFEVLLTEHTFTRYIINYLEVNEGLRRTLFAPFIHLERQARFYKGLDTQIFVSTMITALKQFKTDNPDCAGLLHHRIVDDFPYKLIDRIIKFLNRNYVPQNERNIPKIFERCRTKFLDKLFTILIQQEK